MTWFGRFRRRAALDRDLDRELQDHLERRTQALIAAGLTPAQARRQALIESGGAEQVKEAVRDVRGTRWAHDFVQDVRYGARSLRKSPGLLVAAVLSMGLGIGANTAIFSLVDAVLLRALPVRAPQRARRRRRRQLDQPDLGGDAAPGAGVLVRRAGVVRGAARPLERRRDRSGRAALWVSGSFFETLGVQPALGRLLTPADDRRGGGADGPTLVDQPALLAAPLRRRSRASIGRTLAINRRAVHDRRRRAGALPRADGRPLVRRGGADRHGGPGEAGRPAEPARWPLDVVAQRDVPPAGPASRSTPRRRRCAACSRRSARRRCPPTGRRRCWRRYLDEPLELTPAATGHVASCGDTTASRCWR